MADLISREAALDAISTEGGCGMCASSMNYKLNVQNGNVDYLMMAGKDIVKATTTEERANWAMEQKGVKYECIGGHPEYAIHAGEFYFASIPVKPQKRRREKDVVCE